MFAVGMICVRCGLFLVNVLVLSMIRVSIFFKISSALVFLIKMFMVVLRSVLIIIDIGVVKLSAQGQAMISIAIVLMIV